MEQATISLSLLFWLGISTFASCTNLNGYDLEYKPKSSGAPRALLVSTENEPIQTIATTAFSICLVAKLEDFDGVTYVNLFSFSSREAGEVYEIVFDVDCENRKSHLYIHGERASFDALPPLGQWTWLCVSWESKTGSATFYINGNQAGTATNLQQGYEIGSEGFFVLGQGQEDYNRGFDPQTGVHGKLSHLNLWNRKLTLNEVRQVQSCKLEGNVVSWSESNWKLAGDIQRVESEDTCDMAIEPLNSDLDAALDAIQKNFQNSLTALQAQINELQQNITTMENVVKNQCGREVIRDLMNNYENYSSDVNNLKQRTDGSEKEIKNLKQQLTGNVQQLYNLNKNDAVQSQQINNLKPKVEECCKEVGSIKEKTAGLSQSVNTLLQENGKTQTDLILLAMNTINRTQEILNLLLQNRPNKICPSNFINLDGHCYYFETSSLVPWNETTYFCQSKNPNSKLLSIESKDELDRLKAYLTTSETLKSRVWWWTSGTDQAKAGSWVWNAVGQQINSTFWCPGQPNNYRQNEHCVQINQSPSDLCLNDRDCSAQLNVICEV